MSNHGITADNLLRSLPIALQSDDTVLALAESFASVLANRPQEIERIKIYPSINILTEPLLDILARDFKVDWYDFGFTLEEKRRTMLDSWRVHKIMGTKAAVERAISCVYPHTRVSEWFEYGGDPYHYKLDINITNDQIESDKQKRVLALTEFYKSLRSHNDGITYFVEALPAITKVGLCMPGIWENAYTSLELFVPLIYPIVSANVGIITGVREAVTTQKLELSVPLIHSIVSPNVGTTTGVWETITTQKLELPISVMKSQVMARIDSITGVCENFTTYLGLSVSDIDQMVSVSLRTMAGFYEEFIAQMAVPDGTPTRSVAQLWTALTSTWNESYVTEASPLIGKVLTAITQAQAKSVIASTQEIANTHINLQEVDYGETE